MRIRLKLFATLSDYLPSGSKKNLAVLEVPDGATPHQIMDLCHIPQEQAHLVVLNGVFVPHHQRSSLSLSEDDTLALWPPIAGG